MQRSFTPTITISISILAILTLALVSLYVHVPVYAQDSDTDQIEEKTLREQTRENRADRTELRTAQLEARKELLENRAIGTSSEVRMKNREDMLALTSTQRAERIELMQQERDQRNTMIGDRRSELQERISARRAENEDRRTEKKARLAESAQQRVGMFVANIEQMLTRAADRLAGVSERVAARVSAVESDGVDLTAVRLALEDADALVASAREDIALYADVAAEALASEDPKAHMTDVREAAGVARDSILAAHDAIKQAVAELRAAITPVDDVEEESENADTGASE